MSERQTQKFQIEFSAPSADDADLVTAAELQEFLRYAVEAMRADGLPQNDAALFYADLDNLKVTGI